MEHPQTVAKHLSYIFPKSSEIKNIADNACAAFTTIWLCKLNPSDIDAIEIVQNNIGKGIDEECTVAWCNFANSLTGKRYEVEYRNIKSLWDLRDVKTRAAVLFSKNGQSGHWVGVEKQKIVFNSLVKSVNVEEGNPIQARILKEIV